MGKYTATIDERLILPARVYLTQAQERDRHRSGGVVPAGVPVRLLIDTGSGRSTLVPWVIAHLDPRPGRQVRVETSGSSTATNLFSIRLEFPDTTLEPFPHVAVARVPLPLVLQEFHGLVGRDLLFRWEQFLLEGRRRRLSIRDHPGWFGWRWR